MYQTSFCTQMYFGQSKKNVAHSPCNKNCDGIVKTWSVLLRLWLSIILYNVYKLRKNLPTFQYGKRLKQPTSYLFLCYHANKLTSIRDELVFLTNFNPFCRNIQNITTFSKESSRVDLHKPKMLIWLFPTPKKFIIQLPTSNIWKNSKHTIFIQFQKTIEKRFSLVSPAIWTK